MSIKLEDLIGIQINSFIILKETTELELHKTINNINHNPVITIQTTDSVDTCGNIFVKIFNFIYKENYRFEKYLDNYFLISNSDSDKILWLKYSNIKTITDNNIYRLGLYYDKICDNRLKYNVLQRTMFNIALDILIEKKVDTDYLLINTDDSDEDNVQTIITDNVINNTDSSNSDYYFKHMTINSNIINSEIDLIDFISLSRNKNIVITGPTIKKCCKLLSFILTQLISKKSYKIPYLMKKHKNESLFYGTINYPFNGQNSVCIKIDNTFIRNLKIKSYFCLKN